MSVSRFFTASWLCPSTGPVPASELGGIYGAGYIAGIPRLGIPALHETDGSLGVTNPFGSRGSDVATALPAGLALASSFNPDLARSAGTMVGAEARAKGFNVLLGGGVDLIRDPRNGRNFEYLSEDPLLSGLLAAAEISGTQSQGVVSTIKHYALNANESHRHELDARIDSAALRESDLLAFQIAIEGGKPGSVMCAYNKVNGAYACGNGPLQNEVLKKAWGYPGWVMSDWGAVYDSAYANRGLDQESGSQLDSQVWFDAPLKKDLETGRLTHVRLSNMVRRILRSLYAVGADGPGSPGPIDMAAHNQVALESERQGIVLLKNDGVLPLQSTIHSVAVIGGHADIGVLAGGGSSLVTPPGGFKATIPLGGAGEMSSWRVERYSGAAPVAELQKILPNAAVRYEPGIYPAAAAAAARSADVAVVFLTKFEAEGYDSPDLTLPAGQDALVAAIAAANPNTIVVLETGNPIAMPWRDHVKGDHRRMVSRTSRWSGDRGSPDRRSQSFRPSARHLSGQHRRFASAGCARIRNTGGGTDYRHLRRRRRCRLSLVRQAGPGTAVSVWLRTQLHLLQLLGFPHSRNVRPHCHLHDSQ